MGEEDIQIANVDLELAKLGAEGKKKGQVKGCLFNLIIYSQDPHRSNFLKEIVETITETFPCRIIFIECSQEATQDFLKVTVQEEIVKKEGATFSCDRIDIKCSTKFLHRVPYLVLPHFVPDLPVYLLWGQDPSQENEILPYLQEFATRLIFDPDSSCNIRDFCKKMLSDPAFNKIPVTDMNWASLTSWRGILFQIFDTKEKIEQLQSCKLITIRYNNKVNHISQYSERRAIYLQAWLAAQLNWKYAHSSIEEGCVKISYVNPQGQTNISIEGEVRNDLPSGAIFHIAIQTLDESLFELLRSTPQPFIKAYISKKDVCELPLTLPLRHSKKGLIFMNEIFFVPCSIHYWNMLKALESLQVPC